MSEVRWHINSKGVAGRCKAPPGECPLSDDEGDALHYETAADARAAYEEQMAESEFAPVTKKTKKKSATSKPHIPKDKSSGSDSNTISHGLGHGSGPVWLGSGALMTPNNGSYNVPVSHGGHGR